MLHRRQKDSHHSMWRILASNGRTTRSRANQYLVENATDTVFLFLLSDYDVIGSPASLAAVEAN
jgi:hypothetical protein